MWFIFPQLRGLGRSAMAERYSIVSAAEAREYLTHHVLGPRLKDCVEAIMPLRDRTLHETLGSPDDLKFRSSMTLFAMVDPEDPLFRAALDRWCDGVLDPATLSLLGSDPEAPAAPIRDPSKHIAR
jgi:uncharacterized protein (DUF1810 family)